MISRRASAFKLLIGREELPLATSWTLLFLHNPRPNAFFMIQVLAFELDDFLFVQDWILANCTVKCFLVIFIVNRLLVLPLLFISLIEGYIVLIFINLLKDSRVLIEPFLCRVHPHHVHG